MTDLGYEVDFNDLQQAKDEFLKVYKDTKSRRQQETIDRVENKKGK